MRKHFNIRVSGRVQGVYFRASTKEKAEAMNIAGFVRNDPDGSVYIEAEGEEENIKSFTQWCLHGPDQAQVEKCEIREGALTNQDGFVIKRF